MTLSEHHSRVEYAYRWRTSKGDVELAWQTEKERWVRRFRGHDADGHKGGWSDPQEVPGLDEPISKNDARNIAEHYAGTKEMP